MSRIYATCGALALSSSVWASPAPGGAAAPVLDWNVIALKTTAAAPFNPPLEARNLAIVHAAMFDAVNSIAREFQPYAARLSVRDGASADAAAVAAAHRALVLLYPDQQAVLDAAFAGSLDSLPGGSHKADGVAVGEAVAGQMVKLRALGRDGRGNRGLVHSGDAAG